MLKNLFAEEGQLGHRMPIFALQRFPGCCSAGTISRVSATSGRLGVGGGNPTVVLYPGETSAEDQIGELGRRAPFLSDTGWKVMAMWLLAYRVLKCANPFETLRGLKMKQPPKGGRYNWPSKVWSMCDRTDLDYKGGVAQFGDWLEENQETLGITVTAVDGPSVHGKGSSYTQFGSDKPKGYGTLRTWVIVISDVDTLQKWYDAVMLAVLGPVKSVHAASIDEYNTKIGGIRLW